MTLKKIIRKICLAITIIALINLYSFFIYYINSVDNSQLGIFPEYMKTFSRLPKHVYDVYEGVTEKSIHSNIDPNFIIRNELSYDLYALNGRYAGSNWEISLKNLRNDSLIHNWTLHNEYFYETDRIFSRSEPRLPILMYDKSLIIASDESSNIYRIDKNSKLIWHNTDFQYHHAINLDADSNVWACTREKLFLKKQNIEYWKNGIAKIDSKTGETITHQSINDILSENNMLYLIHGMNNKVDKHGDDPLHLNDIQPVLEDGPYWKKDDLFLSFRHRSLIFLYRPSTNKILRVVQGPFYNQHDVDILSDSTISLFNNNITSLMKLEDITALSDEEITIDDSCTTNINSEVLVYNFNDSTYTSVYAESFKAEKIFTRTEGLHHFISNGDLFVESQNEGKIFILNEKGVVFSDYKNPPNKDDYVEAPHWISIYENINF